MSPDDTVKRFWEWFDEMRGDLSVRQVEARAKCPHSRIGNPYSFKKKPTALVCSSIAAGLKLDEVEVFRQAGLLTNEELDIKRGAVLRKSRSVNIFASPLELLGRYKLEFNNNEIIFPTSIIKSDANLNNPKTFLSVLAALSKERQQHVIEFIEWQTFKQKLEEINQKDQSKAEDHSEDSELPTENNEFSS